MEDAKAGDDGAQAQRSTVGPSSPSCLALVSRRLEIYLSLPAPTIISLPLKHMAVH